MPQRTRDEMHIMLDAELEILQSSKFNQIDPAAKDIYLNTVQDEFIKEAIDEITEYQLTKRIPQGSLTYPDIIKFYNKLHTLITRLNLTITTIDSDTVRNLSFNSNGFTYNATTRELIVTCTSVHGLRVNQPIIISYNYSGGQTYKTVTVNVTVINTTLIFSTILPIESQIPTTLGIISVPEGITNYCITYPNTLLHFVSLVVNACKLNCTNKKKIPVIFPQPSDIIHLDNDPFANNILTGILDYMYIRVNSESRFDIFSADCTFIARPNQIGEGVNCNLPEAFHDELVTRTAKYISAFTNNPNYQPVLNETEENN